MKDLVIELILIAMIVVPLVADSLEPCRITNRHGLGTAPHALAPTRRIPSRKRRPFHAPNPSIP